MSISTAQLALVRSLPLESLRELNTAVVDAIRTKQFQKENEVRQKLAYGDIVRFQDRRGRTRYMKVSSFGSRNVIGHECDANGVASAFPMKWTVNPQFLTKVGR